MEKLCFLGDIHGNFFSVVNFCRKNINKESTIIIQVGDFGVLSDNNKFFDDMEYLNQILREYNTIMYVLRGNHDNPILFNGNFQWDNLKLIPDYTILTVNNKRILCIGGAVSIDRVFNKNKNVWWVDEIFPFDEQKISELKDIDIVATHTSPGFTRDNGFSKLVKNYIKLDNTLVDDLLNESSNVDRCYNILKQNNNIEYWIYGHFHRNTDDLIYNIHFICVDINTYHYL